MPLPLVLKPIPPSRCSVKSIAGHGNVPYRPRAVAAAGKIIDVGESAAIVFIP